jgi:hypothetical protein
MARFRLGSHGLRVDKGRWEGGQHISYEDRTCIDAFHKVWWMTNIMHFSSVLVLLAFAKSEVVQQHSLGSPELSLKALT